MTVSPRIAAGAACTCVSTLLSCASSPPPQPASTTTPAPTSTAPPPPTPPPAAAKDEHEDSAAHEERLIARTLRRVEAARGIRSTKAIPGVLLERPALIARVKDHVTRELPPEAIRNEGLELQLFGFLPTQFDYEAAEYRLLQDQLAGYYEPSDGTMYMANDLGDSEAGATLAHELVHALQDQRWNLADRSKYLPGEGDRSEAVSALAEGDATSAMFDVMIALNDPSSGRTALDIRDDVFAEQIREGMNEGPGASAPHVMRTSLAAPYIYGMLFVHQLRRRGGWAEVNAAWDNAPTTSEQILHVDKWLSHEPAMKVPAPTFAALGPGWKSSDEDTEGELGARLAFEEWMDPATAAEASAGWGGDRGVLVRNGDRAAFGWSLRYDQTGKPNDDKARLAFDRVKDGLAKSLGPASVSDATFVCHERADRGPMAMERGPSRLVIVLGPAKTGGGGWASASNCASVRRWAREILARPQ
jgi:hypothetical protein